LAWRRDPSTLRAPGRSALARRLDALASEQIGLGRRLRKLWLARAQPSNLDRTLGRLRRSARHLRTAARRLKKNRVTPPPETKAITIQGVLESVRESLQ
jgi:hypothetical protein